MRSFTMEKDGPPLSGKEAAKALGVSYPTFQRAVDKGQVPGAFRLGNLIRVPRPVVRALLNGEPLQVARSRSPVAA
jgi:excisionase family DNA binding protein